MHWSYPTAKRRKVRMTNITWYRAAYALFKKDLRAEFRTKTALSSLGVFSLSALLLLAFATSTLKQVIYFDNVSGTTQFAWKSASKFGILWVIFFFAAFSGLGHSFVHEEEGGTTTALRLRMSPEAVYVGKLALNFVIIFSVAVFVTPLYMLVTDLPIGVPFLFILVMISGCLGLSAAATVVAAISAKAQNKGALFPALGLPLIVVFLLLLMSAGTTLFSEVAEMRNPLRDIGGLFSYAVLLITVSALVFRYIWEE